MKYLKYNKYFFTFYNGYVKKIKVKRVLAIAIFD